MATDSNHIATLQKMAGIGMQFMSAGIARAGAQAEAANIRTGGEIAAQGALLSAAGFRQSAASVAQATSFNLEVDKINVNRQLQATTRQYQRLIGKQINQQGGSGLAIGSKSFLMLRNESVDFMGSALLNIKLDAENTRKSRIFESEVRQMNLENQARGAEYQAAAERVLANNRAQMAEYQGEIATFRTISKAIPSLLGSL